MANGKHVKGSGRSLTKGIAAFPEETEENYEKSVFPVLGPTFKPI
jgi:hypothetical protein